MKAMNPCYDLIGDIHGCAHTLEALLEKLGYVNRSGVYQHSERTAIFVGDFVDRVRLQRETLSIVRSMIEAGTAQAVMGNHEFNAIAYYTPNHQGDYLRPRNSKNTNQHQAFLKAYQNDPEGWQDIIEWFKTLPLWLALDHINVIHACWDPDSMKVLGRFEHDGQYLSDELLFAACTPDDPAFKAVEILLKGKELPLPNGSSLTDKDGHIRHNIRVRWWDSSASTYQQAYMGPEQERTHMPDDDINGDHLVEYDVNGPPVFLGHYWLQGTPEPLSHNIACLDYSVAKPSGKLVAYRWQGENKLSRENFVFQNRLEPESLQF